MYNLKTNKRLLDRRWTDQPKYGDQWDSKCVLGSAYVTPTAVVFEKVFAKIVGERSRFEVKERSRFCLALEILPETAWSSLLAGWSEEDIHETKAAYNRTAVLTTFHFVELTCVKDTDTKRECQMILYLSVVPNYVVYLLASILLYLFPSLN